MLNHHMANQCTKFEVSSFSLSGGYFRETEKLNESCDHNYAPFRDVLSHSSVGWDYSYDQAAYQI